MKLIKYLVLIIITCSLTDHAAAQTTPETTESIKIDFSSQDQLKYFWLNTPFARLEKNNGSVLKIDTSKDNSQRKECFKTMPGFLKEGQCYIVEFKCRNLSLGKDSYLTYNVSPFDNPFPNTGNINVSSVEGTKTYRMRFFVPLGGTNYAFHIITKNQVEAIVEEIKISSGRYLDASAQIMPDAGMQIPSGCSDFQIDPPNPLKTLCISASEFGMKEENQDNEKALNDALEYCRKNRASKLTVPKGTYRFTSGNPLNFEGLSDFEFDANGSVFVFFKENKLELIKVASCKRVLLKGFSVDWDWDKAPLASYIKVENIDADGKYADFRFFEYQNFPRPQSRIAMIAELDPSTMSAGCENEVLTAFEAFPDGRSPAPRKEWLSENLLRIYASENHKSIFSRRLKKGALFQMKHYIYDIRGLWIKDCEHLTLSDINIYSCPGMAFYGEGLLHHWQLINVNILKPENKEKRAITCTADHLNISQSQGYFKMINCFFSYGGDDFVNINDGTGIGRKISAKTLRTKNYRHYVAETLQTGDTVELRNDDYSPSGFFSKVTAIKLLSTKKEGIYDISFADEIPASKGEYFIIFNRKFDSGNAIIKNCTFKNNQSRGVIVHSGNITVENCKFYHTRLEAIKITTGYTLDKWSEGYGSSNILIKNNTIESCNAVGLSFGQAAAISISSYIKADPTMEFTEYPLQRNILIEANRFINNSGATLDICSAQNVIFRNNTISVEIPRMNKFSYRGAVTAAYSSHLYIYNNTWIESPFNLGKGIFIDEANTKNVFLSGNSVKSYGAKTHPTERP